MIARCVWSLGLKQEDVVVDRLSPDAYFVDLLQDPPVSGHCTLAAFVNGLGQEGIFLIGRSSCRPGESSPRRRCGGPRAAKNPETAAPKRRSKLRESDISSDGGSGDGKRMPGRGRLLLFNSSYRGDAGVWCC